MIHPVTLISRWTVGSPQRQQAAADAELARLRRIGLPDGCHDLTIYTSLNGESILLRAELAGVHAFHAFPVGPRGAADRDEVDQTVPGIVRHGVTGYRSHRRIHNAMGQAVCTSIVETHFYEPDEALYWAVEVANTGRWSGSLATMFYVSLDHSQALSVTDWSDVNAAPTKPPSDAPRSRSDGNQHNRCEVYRAHGTLTTARR
ncbi:hypothetical protein [Actinoallomurus iriomotensis]|uniref:Uncharacterized protein n=1 Tax=Actinoallomurus iriomotensis TaxID=478107 RepID=A0A9W6S298_9ACTN|nr:hypothetical protein [Actinoallomurus iriomotensis]GLY84447.1 hypothetical protein Airi02_023760 [Actinoallomurus iriomotensis]